jgi:hypothetical protein
MGTPSQVEGGGTIAPGTRERPALVTHPIPNVEASTPQVLSGRQHGVGLIPNTGGIGGHLVAAAGLAMHVPPDSVPQIFMAGLAQQGVGKVRPVGSAAPPTLGGSAMPIQVMVPQGTTGAAWAPAALVPTVLAPKPAAAVAGTCVAGVSVVLVGDAHPTKKVARQIAVHCAFVLMLLALG